MTNALYLSRTLSPVGIEKETLELLLLKAQLSPQAPVEIARCDRAIYQFFSLILAPASLKKSEGAYSQSWNLEALKEYYTALCYELGERNILFPSHAPKLNDQSQIW